MARFVVSQPYQEQHRPALVQDRVRQPFVSGNNPGGVIRDFLESQNYNQGVSGWRLRPDGIIEALGLQIAGSSTIAGWNVDSTKIHTPNATIHSSGYISFGSTPPSSYGNNVGAWLGFSGGNARMSLYRNSNNFLQWDGDKIMISTPNFTLNSSGNLTASNVNLSGTITSTSGTIGGWSLTSNSIQTGSYNASGTRYFGSSGLSLSTGFRVSSTGTMVASGATISGAVTATSGSITGSFSISGLLTVTNAIRSAASGTRYLLEAGGSPRLRLFSGSTERVRLHSTGIDFWTPAGAQAGFITASSIGGNPTISVGEATVGLRASLFSWDMDCNVLQAQNTVAVGSSTLRNDIIYFNVSGGNPGNVASFGLDPAGAYGHSNMNSGGAFMFARNYATVSFVDSNGNYAIVSDIRRKENIQEMPLGEALDIIKNIKPILYNFKTQYIPNEKKKLTYIDEAPEQMIGFSAQEVEQYDTHKVLVSEFEGLKSLKYTNFIPMIVKVIQEQQRQIEELKSMIQ